MANQITKIVIRNGTDTQRREAGTTGIVFNLGEPAYCIDTKRLYVGDNTPGGKPAGSRILGRVDSLFGTYNNTGYSFEGYLALANGGADIGDLIYDFSTRTIYSLSSRSNFTTSNVPLSTDFVSFDVSTLINPNHFFYNNNILNIKSQSIETTMLNGNVADNLTITKDNINSPLRVHTGSLTTGVANTNFRFIPGNSLYLNNTNTNNSPDIVSVYPNQIVGRSATSPLTALSISQVLAGGTYTGGTGIIVTSSPGSINTSFDPSYFNVTSSQIVLQRNTVINGSLGSVGAFSVSNSTPSNSTSTGSFVAGGGAGIAGNLYTGGIVRFNNTLNSSGLNTGALNLAGGASINQNLYVGGLFFTGDGTESTSIINGASVVNGGQGISKNLNVGGDINVGGLINLANCTQSNSLGEGALVICGGGSVGGNLNVGGNVKCSSITVGTNTISDNIDITGFIQTTSSINSINVFSGALRIPNGGVGIGGNLNVGGSASVANLSIVSSSSTALNIPSGGANIAGNINTGGIISGVGANFSGGLTAGGISTSGTINSSFINSNNATIANTLQAGSLINTPIGGSLPSTGSFTNLNSSQQTTFNANIVSRSLNEGTLVVVGGVSISDQLNVGGDIVAFASSDESLKDNKIKINSPLEKIRQISGYKFDWNKKSEKEGTDYGVIAQEIEKILPEIVVERSNGLKAVRYEKIIPLLIEAIKELDSKIK